MSHDAALPAHANRRWWLVRVLCAAVLPLKAAAVPHSPSVLQCQVLAPRVPVAAGRPVVLRFVLHNSGRASLRLLAWNTPFETDWLGPYLSVTRDGQAVAYQGAKVKRGDPDPDDYVLVGAHRTRHARVDLAAGYDLSQPGHYVVEPQLQLHDVMPAATGRSRLREAHQAQALACNPVAFDLH